MANNAFSGAHYLGKGFQLIRQPGIRSFVLIPLLINFVLLSIATSYAFYQIDYWFDSLKTSEYAWIQWTVENLGWLIWPIVTLVVLIVVFYLFAFLANWIAAPFNGLLAEAVEQHLSGTVKSEVFSWTRFWADLPRLFKREWLKLAYYLPRALGCLLIFLLTFWTPFFFIAPIIWFFFNAWMSAIQYIDYPMDNHKIGFKEMLVEIRLRRSGSMGFGIMVSLLTMIPVLNLIVMPAAVAGATQLWFEHYQQDSIK